jgi:hypothetical protein
MFPLCFSFPDAHPRGLAELRHCIRAERSRKLVRGFREELTEEERYRVGSDVVDRLKQHGDPWGLSEDLPPPGKGHST